MNSIKSQIRANTVVTEEEVEGGLLKNIFFLQYTWQFLFYNGLLLIKAHVFEYSSKTPKTIP